MLDDRACRQCGCTEYRACVDDVHGPCWWVEADLCSHCAMRNDRCRAARSYAARNILGTLVLMLLGAALYWIWTH